MAGNAKDLYCIPLLINLWRLYDHKILLLQRCVKFFLGLELARDELIYVDRIKFANIFLVFWV